MPGLFEITRTIILQVWTFINSKLQVQDFERIADDVESWVGDDLGRNPSGAQDKLKPRLLQRWAKPWYNAVSDQQKEEGI